jgi:hypothetical protein
LGINDVIYVAIIIYVALILFSHEVVSLHVGNRMCLLPTFPCLFHWSRTQVLISSWRRYMAAWLEYNLPLKVAIAAPAGISAAPLTSFPGPQLRVDGSPRSSSDKQVGSLPINREIRYNSQQFESPLGNPK